MDDIVREFLSESFQTVELLDRDVSRLDSEGADPEVLKEAFRCVHTIKGSCGFLGFSRLEALTGSGELLLGRVQAGRVHHTPEITAALKDLAMRVREMLEGIRDTGGEVVDEPSNLIARLEALAVVQDD